MRRTRRALFGAGLPALLAAVLLSPPTLAPVSASSTGGSYVALTPQRLLDTRTDQAPLGPNSTLNLQIGGVGSVPTTATAVAINVTVTDTTAASFLSVYPTGSQPSASNLNWGAGETGANLAVVPLSAGGSVTFYNNLGETDLVVDLQGYFTSAPGAGGDYLPLSPQRIADTRDNSGYPGAGDTLGPGSELDVEVAGAGGVPTSGASAAVLNVTVTDTTAASFLAVFPTGTAYPGSSSLNWTGGETVANRVLVLLGAGGEVTVINSQGSADVVVDVSGYFAASGTSPAGASLFYPLAPTRLLDTRADGAQLSSGGSLGEQFAGVGGISPEASAIVANLTATDTSQASYLTMSPEDAIGPTSDLNWAGGATVANLDLAPLSSAGDAYLFNSQGQADVIVDVFGYFAPVSGGTAAVSPCSAISLSVVAGSGQATPVAVNASASCPSGAGVDYSYWYRSPGASSWEAASGWTASASYQYQTSGWSAGTYQLLAWATTQAGIFQGATGGGSVVTSLNPSQNLSDTTIIDTCYPDGWAALQCEQAEVKAINSARAGEGVQALSWPSSLYSLPANEQMFIAADEERVSRGLQPITGLTAAADQDALTGAQNQTDPGHARDPLAIAYASNWAEDYGELGSMFDWMYNDGPGSFNEDCPPSGGSGCWIHRDDILVNTSSGPFATQSGYTWVGGTACVQDPTYPYLSDCSLEWVEVPSTTVSSYVFTWSEAVSLGA